MRKIFFCCVQSLLLTSLANAQPATSAAVQKFAILGGQVGSELLNQSHTGNSMSSSVPLIPKFAPIRTASSGELRNRDTSALRDFDLLGRWAIECTKPASPMNEHSLFSLTSVGNAWVLNDFGPDYDGMVYRIVDAKRVAPDKLSLRQVLASDEKVVLDVVMVKDGERVRIWSSRTADGSVLVQDGTIASARDQQTRWAGRCGERWAVQPNSPRE